LPLHSFNPLNPPTFDRTLVQSGLTLNWTLLDFGKTAARVRAQRALAGAADAALSTAQLQLVARVVNGYLRVLSTRQGLVAQDQRLTALAAEVERERQLLAQGKAARVDQLRVQAEERRAQADRIASAAQLNVAEHELAQLADVPYETVHAAPLSTLRLRDTALTADTSPALRASLVERARDASAEIQELTQRARASDAGVSAARAGWLPDLRVSGAYVDRGSAKGQFAGEWQGAVALSYPIYTGGSRENAIRRATADARGAAEQVRGARLNIERGVDAALASLREAHARVAALESAVDQSAEVVRIERLALDVGSGTQTEYLDAEASLLRARASLIEARHGEISARVELARILGELTPDWLARNVESPS